MRPQSDVIELTAFSCVVGGVNVGTGNSRGIIDRSINNPLYQLHKTPPHCCHPTSHWRLQCILEKLVLDDSLCNEMQILGGEFSCVTEICAS